MDGNQVPQELVTEVGVTFEHILEEVCPSHSFIFLLHIQMLILTSFVFCKHRSIKSGMSRMQTFQFLRLSQLSLLGNPS